MRATPIALCSITTLATCHLAPAVANPTSNIDTDKAGAESDVIVMEAVAPPPVAVATPETIPVENTAVVVASPETIPAKNAPVAIASPESITSAPEAIHKDATTNVVLSSPVHQASESTQTIDQTLEEDVPVEASVSRSAVDLLPPDRLVAQNLPGDEIKPDINSPDEPQPESLDPEDTAAELGEIRILQRPAQQSPRQQPDLQVLLRSAVFSSSNITALDAFKSGDTVFSNTAFLLATPRLGPTTRLVASAGGGAVRFATEGDSNYNLLAFNVGLQQRLAPGMYAQLGWSHDQLYRDDGGDRLLLENAADLTIGRQDQLGKKLRLDSYYNLRASFANPSDQSRVANSVGARLRYDFTPTFQGALDYRLTFRNYTDTDRFDTQHTVSAIATYNINPTLFVSGIVSYLFGRSSNPAIDLNNFSAGITIGLNLPLL